MGNTILELGRRIEILAKTLNEEQNSKADLAEYFGVTEITINRDINWLRKKGVQIFSKKGKLIIDTVPGKTILNNLVIEYLPIKLTSSVFKKQVMALSKSRQKKYFEVLVLMAKSVAEKLKVKIVYKRLSDNCVNEYEILPMELQVNGLNWLIRGYDMEDEKTKSFYLSRIMEIKIIGESGIKNVRENIEESYNVILEFPTNLEGEVVDKIWFENYTIGKYEDCLRLQTEQPLTNALAAWCISWWENIKIIEPKKLIIFIHEMYHEFKMKNP